ncbi:substrate-binding domain-containing protein [Haloferula sp. A504]|uniref:substrate-binding domain-containing protein n=1 Tax=Haloferula sp. A504 TaxID=3373601 RepID=UPI0031BE6133|nr:substrate-binding domain-containing protein [Verrucomicrobiaceae bacterium E54]
MRRPRLLSASEQLAAFLRGEVQAGRFEGLMPGVLRLEKMLGVNRNTVEAALRLLEAEGLLASQGRRRQRRITLPPGWKTGRVLRIGILFHSPTDRELAYLVELQHQLVEKGHDLTPVKKCLVDLGMDVARVARLVGRTEADAWIVLGGSFEVLEWFVAQKVPAFALFGRRRELLIPGVGPDKPPAYAAATRELIRLGHRRIVLLCPPERRIPEPGASERAFLAEIAAHGIPLGRYQLPDWDGRIESLHQRLELLFRYSPPTAMIIDEAPLFGAVMQFLGRKGLRVPEDVSLVCTDHADWFDWLQPSVAHIRWDPAPVVRRIVRWADHLSRGKRDVGQVETLAEFVPGGTIGKAR